MNFIFILSVVLHSVLSLNLVNYEKAIELFNKQSWLESRNMFIMVGEISDMQEKSLIWRYRVYCYHQLNQMPNAAQEAQIALVDNKVQDSWKIGDSIPSLHHMLGVSLYNLGKLSDAIDAFTFSASVFRDDWKSVLLAGDALLHSQVNITLAAEAYALAGEISNNLDFGRLHKARNWIANWQGFEFLTEKIEYLFQQSYHLKQESDPPVRAIDYTNIPNAHLPYLHSQLLFATPKKRVGTSTFTKRIMQTNKNILSNEKANKKILRVAFISSDFGIHPVSSLIRGGIICFSNELHITAYSLTNDTSWWRDSISLEVDSFKSLSGLSWENAAKIIYNDKQDIIIDLNGHTMGSGLPILAHSPAPIQLSYLGYSETTGASFIDYYVADTLSSPPDTTSNGFSEKMGYLPASFMVTDFTFLLRDQALMPKISKKEASLNVPRGYFVFATFCNYKKMEPSIFTSWMNILRRVPRSVLWMIEHPGFKDAFVNIRNEFAAHGVNPSRLRVTPMQPWIQHIRIKSAADLVLDTYIKNGHTTTADALWAGVPVVSIQGTRLGQRWAGSLLSSMDVSELITFSFQEYEDLAVKLALDSILLQNIKQKIKANRWNHPPFQTIQWTRDFQAFLYQIWELKSILNDKKMNIVNCKQNHLYNKENHIPQLLNKEIKKEIESEINAKEEEKVVEEVKDEINKIEIIQEEIVDKERIRIQKEDEKNVQINERNKPSEIKQQNTEAVNSNFNKNKEKNQKGNKIMLHLGGTMKREGWTIVNAINGENTDVIGDVGNLSAFQNQTVYAIYASHVFEHVSYRHEASAVLSEWKRVLMPGGALFVAVPDLKVLAQLYLNDTITLQERFFVMRMMYGGHQDEYDYHKGGYDFEVLGNFLDQSGFCNIQRVSDFNIFQDTSSMKYVGVPISLNVVAVSCFNEEEAKSVSKTLFFKDLNGQKIKIQVK